MFELYRNDIRLVESNVPYYLSDMKIKDKKSALLFIFLMYDRSDSNPVRDLRDDERLNLVKKIVFKEKDMNSIFSENELAELKRCAKLYKDNETSKIQKEIDLYDKKIYQFISLLNSMKPEIVRNEHEITGKVTFSTNIDIITSVLDNSINIIIDKLALSAMKKSGKYHENLRGSLSRKNRNKLLTIKDDTKE